jgi:hypothetical protein
MKVLRVLLTPTACCFEEEIAEFEEAQESGPIVDTTSTLWELFLW